MPEALSKKQRSSASNSSGDALSGPSAVNTFEASEETTGRVHFVGGRMLVPCLDSTHLEILVVKPRVARAEPTVSASEYMKSLGKSCRLYVHSTK